MLHPSLIEARLGELGFRAGLWFRPEIRELEHILMDHEKIIALVCGRYFGNFALLVATDQRLLLIDKRVFFMTIEDTRYDMISEIDYNSQVYCANVTVFTLNKTHRFTTVKNKRQLRDLTTYVQRRVMEFRQQQPRAQNVPTPSIPAQSYRSAQTIFSQPPTAPPAEEDYYVDDAQPAVHHVRHQAGHVAGLVGSAATHAAHSGSWRPRPFNPYIQGSLMTRRPIVTPTSLEP